jgi:tetrahydromethanopterin S-methyltransferase subunit G
LNGGSFPTVIFYASGGRGAAEKEKSDSFVKKMTFCGGETAIKSGEKCGKDLNIL